MTELLLEGFPLVLLLSLRVAIVFVAMPAPFGTGSPMTIRAGLSLMISAVLVMTHVEDLAGVQVLEPLVMMRAALGEMFVGAVIGLTVRMAIAVIEVAGNLIGFAMGLGFANTIDPAYGESSTPFARALVAFSIVIFFAIKGHYIVFGALSASVHAAPPGNVVAILAQDSVLQVGGTMMAQGLRIASPVMATMFLIQMTLGLVARTAPRVQLLVLSFAISVTSGIVVINVAMPTMAYAIHQQFNGLHQQMIRLLGGF